MKRWLLIPMVLFACETMPSSGDLLAPVAQEAVTQEALDATLDVATEEDRVPGEPDPDEPDGTAEPAGGLDAHLLEITGSPSPEVDPSAADEDTLNGSDLEEPEESPPSVTTASWGPRVLTTLSSLEPPRAVLRAAAAVPCSGMLGSACADVFIVRYQLRHAGRKIRGATGRGGERGAGGASPRGGPSWRRSDEQTRRTTGAPCR